MKIIITESQLGIYFGEYIKKFRPELFELNKYPSRRSDKSVYGYEFEIDDTLILIFEYQMEPESEREMELNDDFPKLRITYKLASEIEGIFGKEGIKMLAKWFENYYQLPVKKYFVS